jgi:hypothetical protein
MGLRHITTRSFSNCYRIYKNQQNKNIWVSWITNEESGFAGTAYAASPKGWMLGKHQEVMYLLSSYY